MAEQPGGQVDEKHGGLTVGWVFLAVVLVQMLVGGVLVGSLVEALWLFGVPALVVAIIVTLLRTLLFRGQHTPEQAERHRALLKSLVIVLALVILCPLAFMYFFMPR